jgi:formylglycine-generating enzyme required for sulfatase activity
VYSIQSATGLSTTNLWPDRTLLQAQTGGSAWTDPSGSAIGQQFYRATAVAQPASPTLVFISPGTFTMGSPTNEALRRTDETQHVVTISSGFWMGMHLVTQGEYQSVIGSNPSTFAGCPTCPVEQVSWNEATNYCVLRTQQEKALGLIPANCAYRLPTESEWEYACRAGTMTAFYLGGDLRSGEANFVGQYEYDAALGQIANTNGIYLARTTQVGIYAANGWGLYDMIGNVLEWCQDWYGTYPAGPVTDPPGAASGSLRVTRGGCWYLNAQYCRSAQRADYTPAGANPGIGFRVVLGLAQ